VLDGLRAELSRAAFTHSIGCDVEGDDRGGFPGAVVDAAAADLAIVVVGDRAGLFGRGTVGEGNDVETLDLPGVQRALVEAVVATGTPVILVAITGRPYALDWALPERQTPVGATAGLGSVNSPAAAPAPASRTAGRSRPAAVLQSFFPGEEGGPAIAAVLTGQAAPSGRLPVSLPRSAGAQPYSYLHPVLGGRTDVTSVDPTPVRPFGFGLGYTSFVHTGLEADAAVAAGETFRVSVLVRNTGSREGTDVVQLYANDEVASVARPVAQLIGFRRLTLPPGGEQRVEFDIPSERLAFTGLDGIRSVEPGRIRLWVGEACDHEETVTTIEIVPTV
jgi:beta-glucosidase